MKKKELREPIFRKGVAVRLKYLGDKEKEVPKPVDNPRHLGNHMYVYRDPKGEILYQDPEDTQSRGKPVTDSKIKLFNCSLDDVLDAYMKNEEIQGVNINEELKNPDFRFSTHKERQIAFKVSQALSYTYHSKSNTNYISPDISKLGREAKTKKADDYAISMFHKIEELQKKEKLRSFNATAKKLNENNIPSPTGKTWQAKTVMDLEKRWEKLGLKKAPSPKL